MHQQIDPPDPQANEVRLSDQTIKYLESRLTEAVATGVSQAINKDNARIFWDAGLEIMQEQASASAGKWVLGGLLGLTRKASMFVLLGGLIYAFGGWAALASFAKAVFGGHG